MAEADAGVEVIEATIESMPFADGSVDWIWCRDVLVHVDAPAGMAECARAWPPAVEMLAYVTVKTDLR